MRNNGLKRAVSIVLSAALVLPTVMAFPAQADAAAENTAVVKSAAYNVMGQDEYYYSDEFFMGDSEPYNRSLAALSFLVCNMSYQSGRATKTDQARNLREFLLDNGFTGFEVNDDYKTDPSLESSAVACAHKEITDNGKTYILLAVFPRSGTFGPEFERSLNLGKSTNDIGDHAGYVACKDKLVNFVRKYIKDNGIKGNLKVWTTGYSGGAGISNLFAADIINSRAYILGNPEFSNSDLYAYNFSPMRIASVSDRSDPKDSKYDCIHNVFDDADILSKLPTRDKFDRYGKDYKFREFADKERVIETMRIDNARMAETYVTNDDPDLFMTYKLDLEQTIKTGKPVMVDDPDSYLAGDDGPDQSLYLDGIEDMIIKTCEQADSGADGDIDSREGFVKEYQDAMSALVGYFFKDGVNYRGIEVLMGALTQTKTSAPLLLSMYTSFMVNKSVTDRSGKIDALVEDGFNSLASVVEDEDGSLKDKYKVFTGYDYIVKTYFDINTDASTGKYKLKKSLSGSDMGLLLNSLKELTGALYAASFREALEKKGESEEVIARLTEKTTSEATAWFLTNVMLGNGRQSTEINPLDPDNEQTRQMATFLGNVARYTSMHMFIYLFDWYRAADPYYEDYAKSNKAQNSGYRRVFITPSSGASVSGIVKDESGNTVASFRDGRILSRSDEWIGITTADSGNWLRLPIDKHYKVEMKVSKTSYLDLRIADYSIYDGAEVKTDNKRDWNVRSVKSTDTLTLDVPAVKLVGGSFDMAGAVYSLELKDTDTASGQNDNAGTPSAPDSGSSVTAPAAGNNVSTENNAQSTEAVAYVVSGSIPKAKGVSAKAGRKRFTVKWKRLSKKQRKLFSNVEVQYSTDSSFAGAQSVLLKNSKKSYTLKKLSKGTTYYIRVRNMDGTSVSEWSKIKKVKVR